jgi:hypothetical protein
VIRSGRRESLSTGRGSLFTVLGAGTAGAGKDGQECVRQHRQGDLPVTRLVPADLVVVQAGLVLGLGEAVLDGPPGAGDGDQLGQRTDEVPADQDGRA